MSDGTWPCRSSRHVDDVSRPAVTVVVPVFRTEEHLPTCLESLIRQTFTDFEVIVVDDASPDGGAADIVTGLGDERITVIRHTRNLGLMQARITGVRAARGTYIGFVDSDDDVDERFLEVLHGAATQHAADLVECGILWHEVGGTSWCENRGGDQFDLQGDQIPRAMLAGRMSNSLCNKVMATGLLVATYDDLCTRSDRIDYGEDLITLFDLVHRADRFVHLPDPLYRYRRRATGITVRNEAASLLGNVRNLSQVFDHVRPVLARWTDPADLVEEFFTREFLEPIVAHLKRTREQGAVGPVGSPMSTAELGLLGAVIADAYGMCDKRIAAVDRSANGPNQCSSSGSR